MPRRKYQVVDVVAAAELEYGQPFADIVGGFAADGECPRSIAEILHLDECRLRRFMRRHRIRIREENRQAHEQTDEARRRIAGSLRRRAGRSPLIWRNREWTYPELERATGIPADTIRMRINKGWPIERAATEAVATPRRTTCTSI